MKKYHQVENVRVEKGILSLIVDGSSIKRELKDVFHLAGEFLYTGWNSNVALRMKRIAERGEYDGINSLRQNKRSFASHLAIRLAKVSIAGTFAFDEHSGSGTAKRQVSSNVKWGWNREQIIT